MIFMKHRTAHQPRFLGIAVMLLAAILATSVVVTSANAGSKPRLNLAIMQNAVSIVKMADPDRYAGLKFGSMSQTAAPSSSRQMTINVVMVKNNGKKCRYILRSKLLPPGNIPEWTIRMTRLSATPGCAKPDRVESVLYKDAKNWQGGVS